MAPNLGSLFLFVFVIVAQVFIAYVLSLFKGWEWAINKSKKIKSDLYWNGIFSFFNEGYMSFTLAGLVNVIYCMKIDVTNTTTVLNYCISWILLILSVVYPFFNTYLTWKNWHHICRERKRVDKFSCIYEELFIPKTWKMVYKHNKGYSSVIQLFVRQIRMVFLAMVLVLLVNHPLFAIIACNYLTYFSMICAGYC